MYRLYWIFVVLLIMGCDKQEDQNSKNSPISVDTVLSSEVSKGSNVAVLGYLTKKNGIFFLYSDEKFSDFEGFDVPKFRVQVWLPPNHMNDVCIDSYVVVHGVKHYYIGSAAIDEVAGIFSFEASDVECSKPVKAVNYFNKIKSEL